MTVPDIRNESTVRREEPLKVTVEWATRGVRVNCIAPGPTETEGADRAPWGADGARACADYITGEVLVVDGGQWLGKSVYTDEKANA